MKLKKGDKVPAFKAKDILGKEYDSSKLKSKTLIAFFRYASCPFCNLRMHELIQNYPKLKKKGLKILAFFESPKNQIKKYVGKQDAPFSIISDPKRIVYKKFHIESSKVKFAKAVAKVAKFKEASKLGFKSGEKDGDIFIVPADFLIENGIIIKPYYGKDISDHMSLKDIMRFLG